MSESSSKLDPPAASNVIPVTADELLAGSKPPSVAGPPPAPPAAAPPADTGPEGPAQGLTRDAAGVVFDPEKHLPKPNSKTGRWMPKGGRKPSQAIDPPAAASYVPEDAPAAPIPAGGDVFEAMADMHCRAFYGVAVAFLSDEWLPESGEHEANRRALASYYRAKGMTPDSPGYALALVAITYAGKRIAMPKTQTRLQTFKAWAVRLFANWRGQRSAAQIAHVQ